MVQRMENGRTKQIINKLVDMIENGQSVPLSTGKVAVNKDEAVLMLRELENIVNGELKIYREVNDKRGRIITDAKKEAEDIIHEAEQTASRIRVSKRVSSHGPAVQLSDLNRDDKLALRTANDIYAASLVYTDEMLTEVNDVVAQAYDMIQSQYGRMVEVLEEKAKIIAENKAELMSSLKELSKEERYAQILELGQLLSYELYAERNRVKEAERKGQEQDSDSAFAPEQDDLVDSAFAPEKNDTVDSAFAPEKKLSEKNGIAKEKAVAIDSAFGDDEAILDSAFSGDQIAASKSVDMPKDSALTDEQLTNGSISSNREVTKRSLGGEPQMASKRTADLRKDIPEDASAIESI